MGFEQPTLPGTEAGSVSVCLIVLSTNLGADVELPPIELEFGGSATLGSGKI